MAGLFTPRQRANFRSRCLETSTGCVLWSRYRNADRYGKLTVNRKQWSAHRAAYAEHYGAIEPGMLVLHSCDTPACVNPNHLSLGSDSENAAQKALRKRAPVKLTDQQVKEVRVASGRYRDIAARFDISASMVCLLKKGERRTYVEN